MNSKSVCRENAIFASFRSLPAWKRSFWPPVCFLRLLSNNEAEVMIVGEGGAEIMFVAISGI